MTEIAAYEVSVAGTDWSAMINERSRGRAKRQYHLEVTDAGHDVPFTAMRARKLGPARSTDAFRRCAEYRGVDLECGQAIALRGGARGVIVAHDSAANFVVLFDRDSPQYAGRRLSVHPSELEARP